MKKIKSLFVRDYEGNRQVTPEVVEGSEWVLNGEGQAYRKWDGTSCMIKDGEIYKRYDAKKGKTPPAGAIPCEEKPNEHTGHWPHWVKCEKSNKADKWHIETFERNQELANGTYELIGPKINGNRENREKHYLLRHNHGLNKLNFSPKSFEDVREFLSTNIIEGVVWHHKDGRMVKIKRKDFGFPWPETK